MIRTSINVNVSTFVRCFGGFEYKRAGASYSMSTGYENARCFGFVDSDNNSSLGYVEVIFPNYSSTFVSGWVAVEYTKVSS